MWEMQRLLGGSVALQYQTRIAPNLLSGFDPLDFVLLARVPDKKDRRTAKRGSNDHVAGRKQLSSWAGTQCLHESGVRRLLQPLPRSFHLECLSLGLAGHGPLRCRRSGHRVRFRTRSDFPGVLGLVRIQTPQTCFSMNWAGDDPNAYRMRLTSERGTVYPAKPLRKAPRQAARNASGKMNALMFLLECSTGQVDPQESITVRGFPSMRRPRGPRRRGRTALRRCRGRYISACRKIGGPCLAYVSGKPSDTSVGRFLVVSPVIGRYAEYRNREEAPLDLFPAFEKSSEVYTLPRSCCRDLRSNHFPI